MKTISIVAILLVLMAVSAQAQEKRLNSSPQSFRTFFSTFKSAVSRGEKEKVASMTQFPFKYGFDTGDEGTMPRSTFLKSFTRIFGRDPKKILPERNPLFSRNDDGSYTISTKDAAHLVFVKSKGTYKFTAYIVEP